MKKVFSMIALAALFSCQNDDLVTTETTATNLKQTVTAKNSVVTTETALKNAIATAVAGDIITVSGTIKLTSTLQCLSNGTSNSKINFTGGTLDCSGITSGWGVKVNGNYWNITNMTIKNAPDCGIVFQIGGYNYAYKLTTSNNKDSGLQIYNGSHDNLISYCNSNDNYDAANAGENADGFACKLSGGKNNKFDHCVATHNSDDGWDLYGQPYSVTITNCTAKTNGWGTNGDGNGFKLGSAGQVITHTVTNNIATNNLAWGYDGNGNTGHITTTGSTGSGNGKGLFTRIY